MFMKLWSSDEEKRIYIDENSTYTVLNVSKYVGHKNCSKNTEIPECWKLMILEKEMFDVNDIRVDALIDEAGEYVRLVMVCGWLKRTILFNKNMVIYDCVENNLGISAKNILGSVYKSINNDFNKKVVQIDEYLNQEVKFISLDGTLLEKNPLTNEEIKTFFAKNEELSNDKLDVKTKIKKF